MRKSIILSLLLIVLSTMQAQNKFLPGTITLIDGEPQEAFVKFNNWQNNPEKISYKLEENGTVLTGTVENLDGFTVTDIVTFVIEEVKIDVSSKIAKQITNYREPKWENQRIFLKELIDTGVKLYYFKNNRYERFFYQKVNSDTYEQLIFKPYVSIQARRSYNKDYRKQLKENFNCNEQQVNFRKLEFNYKSIVDFFIDYNSCLGYDVSSAGSSRPKAQTNVYLKAGMAFFGGEFREVPVLNGTNNTVRSSYDQAVGPVLGLDVEIILPQQGQNWSLLIGAHYESFKTQGKFNEPILIIQTNRTGPSTATTDNWDLNVSHLLLGLGVRRSFRLEENKRLFINAGINSNFAIQISSRKYIGDPDAALNGDDFARISLSERNSLYGGFGFSNKKLSVETRFGFGREVLSDIPEFKSKYTSLAVILGFKL